MQPYTGDYPTYLDRVLRPAPPDKGFVLDLFAGCGGLALGFEARGFETLGFEKESSYCATYNANLRGGCQQLLLTPECRFPSADVVIGGPPCQPFSVGGHQRGLNDSRDGFPTFISAIEQVKPKLWMFENVRGLLYRNRWYLNEIVTRLEQLGYVVQYALLNAVDYLVPQNRERVVVVGHKQPFAFPRSQLVVVTAGEALGKSAESAPEDSKYLSASMDRYVAKYEKASQCVNPRDLNLSRPARTLTCRNLGGATGDMQRIRLADGRRRRLLVREAARLQSFPDWFKFSGSETDQFTQIGNSVAPMFAYALAEVVAECLSNKSTLTDVEIVSRRSAVQEILAL